MCHGARLCTKQASVKGLAGALRGEVRLVQQPDTEEHTVGAREGCARGLLINVEVELAESVTIGAGLAACGGGRNTGNVASQFADTVLVGRGLERLRGGAEAIEGVEGRAWADRCVRVARLGPQGRGGGQARGGNGGVVRDNGGPFLGNGSGGGLKCAWEWGEERAVSFWCGR